MYNNIKHKRTERNGEQYNYELENLKNVLHALAALYMLLYKMQKEFYPDCAYACKSDLFEIVIVWLALKKSHTKDTTVLYATFLFHKSNAEKTVRRFNSALSFYSTAGVTNPFSSMEMW